MSWIEKLRRAEEHGMGAARRGLAKAKAGWEDAERAIRRRMRIYPKTSMTAPPVVEKQSPESDIRTTGDVQAMMAESNAPSPVEASTIHAEVATQPATVAPAQPPVEEPKRNRRALEDAQRKAMASVRGQQVDEDELKKPAA